jgi:hypothetical protein
MDMPDRSHPMADHVYARISGFGWSIVPRAPYQAARLPNGTVRVVHDSPGGRREAAIALTDEGIRFGLGEGTTDLKEVLDVQSGPSPDHWRIETAVFTTQWPDGFIVVSEPKPPGFYLRGPSEGLIYLQGPFPRERLPALTAMAAPGQTIRGHGEDWVELSYQHDAVAWVQKHRLVAFEGKALVVTSQTPESGAEITTVAAEQVASSLAPYKND